MHTPSPQDQDLQELMSWANEKMALIETKLERLSHSHQSRQAEAASVAQIEALASTLHP